MNLISLFVLSFAFYPQNCELPAVKLCSRQLKRSSMEPEVILEEYETYLGLNLILRTAAELCLHTVT